MSLVMPDFSSLADIDVGSDVLAVKFAANREYLLSGGVEGIDVWRVLDGKRISAIEVSYVYCLAVSRDGRWIAGGTLLGEVLVWDAKTYKRVFAAKGRVPATAVDFSPDSTRLVAASHRVTIWDFQVTRRSVFTLPPLHLESTRAAKYSPKGDRIATASETSIQVWGSKDGSLLIRIDITVTPEYNTGLLWFEDHCLLAISGNRLKEIDIITGSTVSEKHIPKSNYASCVVLPQHRRFIASSGMDSSVRFCHPRTHTQLCFIQQARNIHSIALSPDDRFIAIAMQGGKINIKPLSHVIDADSIPPSLVHTTFQEPEILIDHTVLELWRDGEIVHAEALLTAAVENARGPQHHVLASRSLIRTRLGQWNAAIIDAQESIKVQRSVIGYIAKCVALVGEGKAQEGIRMCDIAFEHFHSNHATTLLLIKAVVLFMAGKHNDAISRIDNLIDAVPLNSTFFVIQESAYAYMYLSIGNRFMRSNNYEHGILAFQHARTQLHASSSHEVRSPLITVSLISGWKFDDLGFTIQRCLCEAFYTAGRFKDASEAFLDTLNTFSAEIRALSQWTIDFKSRCTQKLKELGDDAMVTFQYDEAICHYSAALLLDPINPQDLLVQRSRAYVGRSLWEDALNDANQVIKLEPSSPLGYERKHAALHGARCYDDATHAFERMLLKMSLSSKPDIRERSQSYLKPIQIKNAIRAAVKKFISELPPVLINTQSGRLLDKSEQASSFEQQPVFQELISSMTMGINRIRIKHQVAQYYRYTTLSHKWEPNEPLFENVINAVVYDLRDSPTHNKLKMFCEITRDAGFNWAWSDTCCINKMDHFKLQEALVSMFRWYQGSALTIIFLCGVYRFSQRGALMRSVWNTRAWTLQEYHASKVVRFYTQDWTPYMNLTIENHKESPDIISEMEQATRVSAQALMALHPGSNDIREKLRLASTRKTSQIEDEAYSLLGIFSISLPVVYGERDKALGRLLAQLLTNSADTSILAWTGKSGSFNSCLPTAIMVFKEFPISQIPPAITGIDMEATSARLSASSVSMDSVIDLYDQLNALPVPSFSGQRMRLPCFGFKLGALSVSRNGSEYIFRAQTAILGTVEIRTMVDLSLFGSLQLIHPWIDFLLDRRHTGNIIEDVNNASISTNSSPSPSKTTSPILQLRSQVLQLIPRIGRPQSKHRIVSTQYTDSLRPPSSLSPEEIRMCALGLITRLRKPFGALLFTPIRQNVAEYKRVAARTLITVQIKEVTPTILDKLKRSIGVLDVL